MKKTALAILLASMAMPSFAALDTTGFSGEVLLGSAEHELSGGGVSFSDDVYSYGIRGAYQINENFAVEVGYQDLGEAEFKVDGVTIAQMDISALTLGVKGMYPLQNGLSVVGRFGLSSISAEASASGTSASDDANELYFGIGGQYDINEQFYVGVEYLFASSDIAGELDYDIGNLSLSAGIRF